MILYVPNPAMRLDDIIDALSQDVVQAYTTVENTILQQLARRAQRALQVYPEMTARLQAVQALREGAQKALASISPDLAYQIIQIAQQKGTAAAVDRLKLATNLPQGTPFTSTSAFAVAQTALDLNNTFEQLHSRILRWDQDAYQQLIAGHVPGVLLGADGKLTAQKNAVAQWLRDGVPGFVDKAGRSWRVGSYVEMATRTAVQRAYIDAGNYRMQQAGVNLVTIVVGSSACQKCAAWIGKILATAGPTGDVQVQHATEDRMVTVHVAGTLDEARAQGWGHPNCRCRPVAYLPGLSIPNAATTYDPVRESARDAQRGLERDIRQSKRELMLTTDPDEQRRLKSDIRDSQASIRDLISKNDLPRMSWREQVAFADGKKAA